MYNEETYDNLSEKNPMAAASLIFGLLSIFLCVIIYFSLPAGALAILFAILSRVTKKIPGRSKAGIVCGLIGIIATLTITIGSFYFVFTNDTARAYLEQYFRYYTGDTEFDLDKELNNFFSSYGLSWGEDSVLPDSESAPEYSIQPEPEFPENDFTQPGQNVPSENLEQQEGVFL